MVMASERRLQAVLIWIRAGGQRGSQTKAARELGVHRSQVCRALKMWHESQRNGWDFRLLEDEQRLRQRLEIQERRAADAVH